MTIVKNPGRQWILGADLDLEYQDLTSGTAESAIDIPTGATIHRGFLVVDTLFNSGTSDVLIVGDILDNDRYLGSTSLTTAGVTELTSTGYVHGNDAPAITVTWTGVGTAATQGKARLFVEFSIKDKANEVVT